MEIKLVSFIVVVKNGESSILKCLSSLENQNLENFEVLIVDGKSIDNTVAIAEKYLRSKNWNFRIIENPKMTLASGWNLALESSKSKYVVRPDSHSILEENYILNGIKILEKNNNFSAVGGVLKTESQGFIGELISKVLSNPLGVGPSKFRIGLSCLTETDTVVYGVYRKELFIKIGGFNEELKRNQDIEFHKRASDQGVKMLTSPNMVATYFSRATIKTFCKQAYSNGFWVGKGHGYLRHFVPLFFISVLIVLFSINLGLGLLTISIYFIILLIAYILYSKILNPLRLVVAVLLTFMLHILYGLGTLIAKIK